MLCNCVNVCMESRLLFTQWIRLLEGCCWTFPFLVTVQYILFCEKGQMDTKQNRCSVIWRGAKDTWSFTVMIDCKSPSCKDPQAGHHICLKKTTVSTVGGGKRDTIGYSEAHEELAKRLHPQCRVYGTTSQCLFCNIVSRNRTNVKPTASSNINSSVQWPVVMMLLEIITKAGQKHGTLINVNSHTKQQIVFTSEMKPWQQSLVLGVWWSLKPPRGTFWWQRHLHVTTVLLWPRQHCS